MNGASIVTVKMQLDNDLTVRFCGADSTWGHQCAFQSVAEAARALHEAKTVAVAYCKGPGYLQETTDVYAYENFSEALRAAGTSLLHAAGAVGTEYSSGNQSLNVEIWTLKY